MTREEALQWLTNEKWKNANNKYKKEWNEAFDMAIEALSEETIEIKPMEIKGDFHIDDDYKKPPQILGNVEVVVRCKDCRWYENRYGEVCHNPRYGDGHANYSPPYVDEEYFCKDGERREP